MKLEGELGKGKEGERRRGQKNLGFGLGLEFKVYGLGGEEVVRILADLDVVYLNVAGIGVLCLGFKVYDSGA